MPTKPGSCGLPYYGIEFAVLDPVVCDADTYAFELRYHTHIVLCHGFGLPWNFNLILLM